jgi:hypothetical protein
MAPHLSLSDGRLHGQNARDRSDADLETRFGFVNWISAVSAWLTKRRRNPSQPGD